MNFKSICTVILLLFFFATALNAQSLPEGTDSFEEAKKTYSDILVNHPDDFGANLNLGLLHYNLAVEKMNASSSEPEYQTLQVMLDETTPLFKQSLPYLLKAYDQKPQEKTILRALSGIYFSTHDLATSERYQAELKALE